MRCIIFSALILFQAHASAADLAVETVPPGEAAATKAVVDMINGAVEAGAKATGTARRDAHPKAHGCVRANFQVNPTLPDWARNKGVFQEGAEYKAWIRYSNGSGQSQDDSKGDGRGMAIKLTKVPGVKLEADEKSTQDFLLINHPEFFVRNAEDYVKFTKANLTGNPLTQFFLPRILHEGRIAITTAGKKVDNPLAVEYFSMTPYLLGEGQAVKHGVRPCTALPTVEVDRKDPDFLRKSMITHLAKRNACFEFTIQRQVGAKKMPIEDPTIAWSTKRSEYVKVATLTIPAQNFNSKAQQQFCENLSLNPWHSLPAHRPLGGINRVRRVVYQTISATRLRLNHEARLEPTGVETFPNN